MKKAPKEIVILVVVALVICVVMLAMVIVSNKKSGGSGGSADVSEQVSEMTTEEVADVEPIALPDKSEVAAILGFEPKQLEVLSDKFVLRSVNMDETGVTYGYQTHLAANAVRMNLILSKMSEDEYKASLPAESVREAVDLDGRSAVFADRIFYRIPEDEELAEDSVERMEEKEGKAIVQHGGIYKELSKVQTLDWYENGCKYELYADYLDLDSDEMKELALNYINNAK